MNKNQSYIVVFKDADEDDLQQYFISIEHQLMLESSNILTAVFSCLASHYIFNLSYQRRSGDFWVFIQ